MADSTSPDSRPEPRRAAPRPPDDRGAAAGGERPRRAVAPRPPDDRGPAPGGERLRRARADGSPDQQPDVLLDVPELKVDEISLEVNDLQARVSLQAQVLDLVKLHVGADVSLGRVSLEIKGVEAAALLKVRLDNVVAILDRVMTTLDENPQILGELSRGLSQAVGEVGRGSGQALQRVGEGAGGAVEQVGEGAGGAVKGIGEGAGGAVERVGEGAGGAVERVGEGAGGAVERVGEGAGDAAEDAGEAVGGAAEQAGEAAGSAIGADQDQPTQRRAPRNRGDKRR